MDFISYLCELPHYLNNIFIFERKTLAKFIIFAIFTNMMN